VTAIAENIQAMSQQIRTLEARYGRQANTVKLLAVSKQQSSERIREAAMSGATDFGENYLQEAEEKITALDDLDLCWHFIGPIQSNKTRSIAESFTWVHSVDRLKIARRLSEQRPAERAPINICIQVNLSAEDSKSGVALEEVATLCDQVAQLPQLRLRGLMAIPAAIDGLEAQRAAFRPLAECFRALQTTYPDLDTLSLGMSNDFEAAIAEGSTMVRLGTAVFGPRN
jgi:hypothetical protein